jgi:hypothetical protein
MADGFLGRWSRRKLEVKQGKGVEQEPLVDASAEPSPQPSPASGRGGETAELPLPPSSASGSETAELLPPPTLKDVEALTAESDFSRFTARDVAPEVKNAALKKLFADPHYNVMDRLDVYIDDYSQPDPMPESMLRQLASAKFLGLFKDEETRDDADDRAAPSVAKSDALPEAVPEAVPEPTPHADPHLRLQQDHAAAGKDPGHGTE